MANAQSAQRQASTVTLFAVRGGANRAPVLMKSAKAVIRGALRMRAGVDKNMGIITEYMELNE